MPRRGIDLSGGGASDESTQKWIEDVRLALEEKLPAPAFVDKLIEGLDKPSTYAVAMELIVRYRGRPAEDPKVGMLAVGYFKPEEVALARKLMSGSGHVENPVGRDDEQDLPKGEVIDGEYDVESPGPIVEPERIA